MSAVLFARTRHVYESYVDFWQVLELSGYDTCYVDEIDAGSDNLYIIPTLNGEVGNGWPGARARIVHWNLEWCEYPRVAGINERWHMDADVAARFGSRYVPVGGHPALAAYGDTTDMPTIDLAYMGYMTPRRQAMAVQFDANALSRTPTSVWEHARHSMLTHSTLYAHVHQHDDDASQGVPALRMIVAAAYRLPMLCERVNDPGIFGSSIMQADYMGMANMARVLVSERGDLLRQHAEQLWWTLCVEHTFRQVIEAAV